MRHNSEGNFYEFVPCLASLLPVPCLEEQAALAHLREELFKLPAEALVFAYASKKLVAPLLCRLFAGDPENHRRQIGVIYLNELLSQKTSDKIPLVDIVHGRNLQENSGRPEAELSNCANSSRVLYLLVQDSLAPGGITHTSLIQPYCRPLALVTAGSIKPLPPTASDDIRIFYSHLSKDRSAYDILFPLGNVLVGERPAAVANPDLSFISSDEEEDQGRKTDGVHSVASHALGAIRPVAASRLMVGNFLPEDRGQQEITIEDNMQSSQDKIIEEDDNEEANQARCILTI